jgi:hypothetical protein
MMLARRALLRMGAAALLTTGTGKIAWAENSSKSGVDCRRLKFESLHTGEKLDAPY